METLSEMRPWGWFKGVSWRRFWIKLIKVHSGDCTSLQYHAERDELHILLWPPIPWEWSVVRRYKVHRLLTGLYVEFAWGRPREDDIVRIGDRYGRSTPSP